MFPKKEKKTTPKKSAILNRLKNKKIAALKKENRKKSQKFRSLNFKFVKKKYTLFFFMSTFCSNFVPFSIKGCRKAEITPKEPGQVMLPREMRKHYLLFTVRTTVHNYY